MREILRNNGLSLALFALFLASIVGQVFAGWYALGEELAIHGQPAPDLRTYLSTDTSCPPRSRTGKANFYR